MTVMRVVLLVIVVVVGIRSSRELMVATCLVPIQWWSLSQLTRDKPGLEDKNCPQIGSINKTKHTSQGIITFGGSV